PVVKPASNAKTVRKQPDGRVLVTDGPYTETKEHMGGFWILEAADMDEALAWARSPSIGAARSRANSSRWPGRACLARCRSGSEAPDARPTPVADGGRDVAAFLPGFAGVSAINPIVFAHAHDRDAGLTEFNVAQRGRRG